MGLEQACHTHKSRYKILYNMFLAIALQSADLSLFGLNEPAIATESYAFTAHIRESDTELTVRYQPHCDIVWRPVMPAEGARLTVDQSDLIDIVQHPRNGILPRLSPQAALNGRLGNGVTPSGQAGEYRFTPTIGPADDPEDATVYEKLDGVLRLDANQTHIAEISMGSDERISIFPGVSTRRVLIREMYVLHPDANTVILSSFERVMHVRALFNTLRTELIVELSEIAPVTTNLTCR